MRAQIAFFAICLMCSLCLFESVWADESVDVGSNETRASEPSSHVSERLGGTAKVSVGDLGIEPTVLRVEPGTTVVWLNTSGSTMRVQFTSKAVSTTCKAPHNFGVGLKGVYRSEEIKTQDVASLCFLEPNTYNYRVESLESAEGAEGYSFDGSVEVGG